MNKSIGEHTGEKTSSHSSFMAACWYCCVLALAGKCKTHFPVQTPVIPAEFPLPHAYISTEHRHIVPNRTQSL